MIKKMMIMFVVLSVAVLSTLGSLNLNSNPSRNSLEFTSPAAALTDSELKATTGNGLWDCIVAAGKWVGGVVLGGQTLSAAQLAGVHGLATLFGASWGLAQAWMKMANECSGFKMF